MPLLLKTLLGRIPQISNSTNAELVNEFHAFMKEAGSSERHQRNALLVVIQLATFLGPHVTFFDVKKKDPILAYLDTKRKSQDEDPDGKWITTWNHYLARVKYFFRWINSQRGKDQLLAPNDWETPAFLDIRQKKTKRLSPYSETDIWDRDEFLSIIKYAAHVRDKAALALFWDLDARNHEVTLLKIKNIRLREKFGEGEIPHESKTGTGPILLTLSFPYVRDWMKIHPFKNQPDARVICNLRNGSPVRPDAMWWTMRALRSRIVRLIQADEIKDQEEVKRLEVLLATKKWNPYCIRHSAITYDSDSLPGYALNKKVRWSMTSKQPARYIKRRMGNDLKRQLLLRDGIQVENITDERSAVRTCNNCNQVNAIEFEFCTSCRYPLTPKAAEKQRQEDEKHTQEKIDRAIEQKFLEFLASNPDAAKAMFEQKRKQLKSLSQ